jgi:hypothetical protein
MHRSILSMAVGRRFAGLAVTVELLPMPVMGLAAEPGLAPTAVPCESVAALIDGKPLPSDRYALLDRGAEKVSETLLQDAPLDGGRYWTRADYADGFGAAPYPHYGCFADVRYLIAWFCQADRGWVSQQWGCVTRRRVGVAERAPAGCVRTRLSLREPIIYCAPGHSPQIGAPG